jgi:hypothetical protein
MQNKNTSPEAKPTPGRIPTKRKTYLTHPPRKSRRLKPTGVYLNGWRNVMLKAKAKRRRDFPRRPSWLVKQALASLRLRYWMEVSLWNPHHRGKGGELSGGLQWIDFVVRYKGIPTGHAITTTGNQNAQQNRLLVLIVDYRNKRFKEYERKYIESKLVRLTERGLPHLILPETYTSQEYAVMIQNKIRQLKRSET